MPVVSITLEETDRSVLSPIYNKIVSDVASIVKVPSSAIVVMSKNWEPANTDSVTTESILSKENTPKTIAGKKIIVTINEEYNEDHLSPTAVHQSEMFPIFMDNEIDVQIYPIYVQTDVSIEFVYSAGSLSAANRIRDDMRIRLSQTRDISIHEVEYTYILPPVIESFIEDVYDLKNRLKPSRLDEYLYENSTKRLYPITDMSNKENTRLGVYEKQVRIVGFFDFSPMPEKVESDHESNNHKVVFNYKFSVSLPKAIAFRYPTTICNRTLPNKYLDFIEEAKKKSMLERRKSLNYIGNSMADLSMFEAHRELERKIDVDLPIVIPDFDEFSLRQGHRSYAIVMSVLPEVDETDMKSLFNLNDLGDYCLPDILLNYIRTVEYPFITFPNNSFIYLGLHQEDKHFDNHILEVNTDLDIKSTVGLNIYTPNRVTLGFIIDFSSLNEACKRRLEQHLDILLFFVREYISTVNNYKVEAARYREDLTFYYWIIGLIDKLLDLGDLATLQSLLNIFTLDSYFGSTLGRILYTEYNSMYNRLYGNQLVVILDISYMLHPYTQISQSGQQAYNDLVNSNNNNSVHRNDKSMVMKTLMLTTLVTKNMETLNGINA